MHGTPEPRTHGAASRDGAPCSLAPQEPWRTDPPPQPMCGIRTKLAVSSQWDLDYLSYQHEPPTLPDVHGPRGRWSPREGEQGRVTQSLADLRADVSEEGDPTSHLLSLVAFRDQE